MLQQITKLNFRIGTHQKRGKVPSVSSRQHWRAYTSGRTFTVNSVKKIDKGLSVTVNSNVELKFNNIWLRDHCRCPQCYFEATNQRDVNTHTIPLDIQPKDIELKNNLIKILWPDDHVSKFDINWLYQNRYGQPYHAFLFRPHDRKYWSAEKKNDMVYPVEFDQVMNEDMGLYKLLNNIAIYGHGFVSDTPLGLEEGVKKLGKRIGPLKESIYGDSWDITNKPKEDIEFLDTAYLNVALPGHTDGTYSINTPGLQFFHISHHDGEGGDSLLVDAIYCAEILRQQHPDHFHFLSTKSIPGVYYEQNHYWSRDYAPMINVDAMSQQIFKIRFNDLDRDVLSCLSYEDIQRFYEALHAFTKIMTDKKNELWYRLQPGTALIVDNWRVLHGRSEFTGTRSLQGLYINRDDYLSKIRLLHEKFGDL